MPEQPFLFGEGWITVKDGDETGKALFDRHYSRYRYRDGRSPRLYVGPGEKLVMLRRDGRALWVWRKFISDNGQDGINCAIFRNEGQEKSSTLIREADAIAFSRWPGERHYTYVDAKRVRSTNPGYCFLAAGWRKCGMTKSGKHILEITEGIA